MVRSPANVSGKNLRYVMTVRGVSTAALAETVGVSIGTIYNIISGHSESRKTRQKISNYLAASIWPGIGPETILATIPRGTRLTNLTKAPHEIASEYPAGAIKIFDQATIKVIRPIDVILRIPTREGATAETMGAR